MYGESLGGVGGGMRSKSPKVQRFLGPGVQGSQGPRYLKLTFKYELDSKEGPSCCTNPHYAHTATTCHYKSRVSLCTATRYLPLQEKSDGLGYICDFYSN